jgi:hypothetical protein
LKIAGIVKLGFISLIVFFIILDLMSLLIPSHVRISRAIDIQAPREKICPWVSDLKNWQKWNEMANDGIEVKILSADCNLITTSWKYNNRTVKSSFRLEESANITVVQWYFDFELKWYPWEKFGSITFDKQFGTPMERSLINLKKLVENSP